MDKTDDGIKIIGFSGKMGSGKDYISINILGDYLTKNGIPYIHMAFSDALKVELMAKGGYTYESLYIKKTIESRMALQKTGMDMRKMDDTIWIKYLDSWMRVYSMRGTKIIIISDVRFPIEYNYIKDKGGIIFRIIAPNRTLKKMKEETNENMEEIEIIKKHISETAMDEIPLEKYDAIFYNDDIDNNELLEEIKRVFH
jgi:hypothetical protein